MRLVVGGGGTGGHLFPGIAIAEAFIEWEKGNEVLFIGTERGIEMRILGEKGFRLKTIGVKPIKGRSILEKIKAIWGLPRSILDAVSILREFKPDMVIGVGGYASAPVLIAAWLMGIKRVLHEQNVIPGMANRILKYFTHHIFISFEGAKRYFPKNKTTLTGMPVRKDLFSFINNDNGNKRDKFNIFIFGGSAGAHRINEKMLEALDYLEGIRSSLRLIHQTGFNDYEWVSSYYRAKGFEAIVKPFFDDMGRYYKISHLVICRAGASTIAELAICGKASILIPYPYAAHNHQFINAKQLVEIGAAMMIEDRELTGKGLSEKIIFIFEHPEEREKMEKAVKAIAMPDAAKDIVRYCYQMVTG